MWDSKYKDWDAADCVLEVGAGTGSLTGMLAQAAGRVVAVEIDRGLARLAGQRLSGPENVVLIERDALDRKSMIARDLGTAIGLAHAEAGGPLKMVAHLPSDIATPLIMNLLLGELPVGLLCFTVQTEVADRLLAPPGVAAYGPVSIITQILAAGRRICRVPPQAFWPAPKVHSAMVRLDVRPASTVPVSDPTDFAGLVRSFFQHRRKTIAHTAKRLNNAERLLAAIGRMGVQPGARPENLTVEQWVDLYHAAV